MPVGRSWTFSSTTRCSTDGELYGSLQAVTSSTAASVAQTDPGLDSTSHEIWPRPKADASPLVSDAPTTFSLLIPDTNAH